MPIFEYDALTPEGKVMTGTIESPTGDEAASQLAAMGLNVQALRQSRGTPKTRIGRAEFLLFNQQLASITRSGLPLERGLRELAADVESPRMRKLLTEIAGELEAGATIDQVFEKRKDCVPPLYGKVLQAGLKSGRLSEMLGSLNRHLEMAGQTRRILFEALTYPTVVLLLAAMVLTFLFQVLMPRFDALYDAMRSSTHFASGDMFLISRQMAQFWLVIGLAIAAGVAAMVVMSRLRATRHAYERIMLRLPLLGRIYHLSLLSRLADAMATLVSSGSDMPSCLRLGAAATGSELFKRQCETVATGIEGGRDLLTASESCGRIPGMFFYSMQQGAQRNELQDNLLGLSEMYARQAISSQSKLQAVLLPSVLIVVGAIVGSSIYSLFSPIINMIRSFQEF